ncbi:alpha-galactosidase [Bacteroides finegoldii]|nr:alpha-galactosidase [Bacteroides finegoldii]
MRKNILVPLIALIFAFGTAYSQNIKQNVSVDTEHSSLVFSVDENDELIFRHYGKKMNHLNGFSKDLFTLSAHQNFPSLYPTYGGRSYIIPALKLTHNDGVICCELKLKDIRTNKIDSNITETVVELKDKVYDLFVDVHYTAYYKEDVITQYISVRNQEKGKISVEQLASSYLPLQANSYYLTHFYGSWSKEMNLKEEELTNGVKSIESLKGVRTSQCESPTFVLSLDGKSQEYEGEVYGGALAWSGNYKLSFQVSEDRMLHIVSGMNPFAAALALDKGDEVTTPKMVLTYSSEGKNRMSQNFHHWSRKYALAHGNSQRPVILNSWEGTGVKFNEEKICAMIDDAASLGIELFVLDDGWFGNKYPRNATDSGLGDWQVNKKKLPRGIGYLAEYAKKKGLQFGLWVEPEMVNPKSELAENHPDWVVKTDRYTPYTERNQWLLDLTNPEVQNFIVKTIDDMVAMSPNLTYIKWDANRYVNNVGSSYLPADKQSRFWYDYVKGLYSVYNKIREKYPDLMLQACSSGGGRMDFGSLKYHDEFWASDNTNAVDRIYIQHGSSMFFPSMAIASHVSTAPNHQTGMSLPLKYRFDVAMSGRFGMELQPKDMTDKELEYSKKAIETYKRIRPVIQHGDLYRLISPYDNVNRTSLMYVSEKKDQAIFFVYNLGYHERNERCIVKLKGLNPDAKYKVVELNKMVKSAFKQEGIVLTGEYLMNVGIPLTMNKPHESCVLEFTEVK